MSRRTPEDIVAATAEQHIERAARMAANAEGPHAVELLLRAQVELAFAAIKKGDARTDREVPR